MDQGQPVPAGQPAGPVALVLAAPRDPAVPVALVPAVRPWADARQGQVRASDAPPAPEVLPEVDSDDLVAAPVVRAAPVVDLEAQVAASVAGAGRRSGGPVAGGGTSRSSKHKN